MSKRLYFSFVHLRNSRPWTTRCQVLPMIKLFFTKNKQYETMVNFNFVQTRKRHVENCYIIFKVC